MHLHFNHPYFLIAGIVWTGAALWFLKRGGPGSRYRLLTSGLGFIFCFLALAQPQLGSYASSAGSRGADIYFALDISQSMIATDIAPSRLAFATTAIQKIIENITGRVSLFVFAADGYVVVPLTDDQGLILEATQNISPSYVTRQGTQFTPALTTLLDAIKKVQAGGEPSSTAVVLFSDGETHEAVSSSILAEYRRQRISVFTVGTATEGGAEIQIALPNAQLLGGFGSSAGGAFGQFKTVRTRLEKKNLADIASATGGEYYPARLDSMTALTKRVQTQTRFKKAVTQFQAKRELYPFCFAAALLFLLIAFSLRRWEFVFAVLALVLSPQILYADVSERQAVQFFNQGLESLKRKEFPIAAEKFQQSALLTADKKIQKQALYNLGNTLIQAGKPKNALDAYQSAYDIETAPRSEWDKSANQRISENIALAQRWVQRMKKQPQSGDDKEKSKGEDGKDPKGPQKDYEGQKLTPEQKKRIYDLVATEEQQANERLQAMRNRKRTTEESKPW